jgi:hypothetical protein
MLSFHQSRGRILFEASCAIAIAASFVGAWMDLGTTAFLTAAAVFGLCGLVRLFDMRRSQPAPAFVEVAPATNEQQVECPPVESAPVETSMPELVPEPVPSKPARARRKKQAAAKPAVVEIEEPSAGPIVVAGLAEPDEPQPEAPAPTGDVSEELDHPPVTPLFEPEPFVRQQRAVFGRKAG